MDFGGGPLTSAGGMDLFLAKYTASGTHLWSLRLGGGGDEIVRCIALDSNGDIFVGGSFSGTTDLGGGALTSAGGADIFLAKYSSSGAYLWAKRLGGTADDGAYGMQVDSIGNLLVTGFFMRGVDLGGGFLSNPPGGLNTFVAKYSSAGAHVWSKSFWSSADNQGYGLVVDGNGDLVVTGVFSGQIDAGGGVLTTRGGVDGYLAKFSSAGVPIWSKGIGGANADRAECIAADSSGNLFVLGRFSQLSDWGGGPMTTASFDYDVVLAKYSPSGACLWAKPFAGPGDQTPSAVKTDANGNVVITGCFPYSINLGGLPLISAGMEDVFVAKYSSSGAHLWSERFGGSSFDQGIGLAVDGTGHVVVTGTFMGTADFGGQVLSSAGSYDAFLLRLDP